MNFCNNQEIVVSSTKNKTVNAVTQVTSVGLLFTPFFVVGCYYTIITCKNDLLRPLS